MLIATLISLVLITIVFGSILLADEDLSLIGIAFFLAMIILLACIVQTINETKREEAYKQLTTGRASVEAYYVDHKDGTRTVEYRSWQQPVETPSPILGPKQ